MSKHLHLVIIFCTTFNKVLSLHCFPYVIFPFPLKNAASAGKPSHPAYPISWMYLEDPILFPKSLQSISIPNAVVVTSNMLLLWVYEGTDYDATFCTCIMIINQNLHCSLSEPMWPNCIKEELPLISKQAISYITDFL